MFYLFISFFKDTSHFAIKLRRIKAHESSGDIGAGVSGVGESKANQSVGNHDEQPQHVLLSVPKKVRAKCGAVRKMRSVGYAKQLR